MRICEDAVKQPNEAIVQGCLAALGRMAAHAMTMVHTTALQRTAPLAFSPVFYIEQCVKASLSVGMDDALLTAIEGTRQVFARISPDIDSNTAIEGALGVLFIISAAGYARPSSIVVSFRAVEMMLRAAQQDIRLRGYRGATSTLSIVLRNIAPLVPLEVAAEKGHQRMMVQTFPPYSLTFESCLPALVEEAANKLKSVGSEGSCINLFHEFSNVSDAIVDHYRDVARAVDFEGLLLEKWTVDSLLRAARVHINLLDNFPTGAERFVGALDKCLRRLVHVAAFFFSETTGFPFHHASDACGELARIGMGLLQRQRFEPAVACGEAIRAIARKGAEAVNSETRYGPYGFADCVVKLEILARAADAFNQPQLASTFRKHGSLPENIPQASWPEFAEAVGTRVRQMEEELCERGRDMRLKDGPVDVLREILSQPRSTPAEE
jgi:hypothetical protein